MNTLCIMFIVTSLIHSQ